MRELNRRATLKGLTLASLLATSGAAASSGLDATVDPRLLVVYLRGGLDALAAMPPVGDSHFAQTRGSLQLGLDSTDGHPIPLDDLFALHSALAPLLPAFVARQLAIVPATAILGAGRSHARAEAALFDGDINDGATGWLDRAAAALPGVGQGVWRDTSSDRSLDFLTDLLLGNPLFDMSCLSDMAGTRSAGDLLTHNAAREASRFSLAAANAAGPLSAERGPRIAILDLPGFDTHVAQAGGRLSRTLGALAEGLVSFAVASGPAWRQTVVLVVTEFGRTVAPNKGGGTDHGHASITLLIGGAVAGGRIRSTWPGLGSDTQSAVLAATTDTRSVIKAVLGDHLRLSDRAIACILPGAATIPAMPDLFNA